MRLEKEARVEDMEVGHHERPSILTCVITLGMVPIEFWLTSSRLQFPINGKVTSYVVKGLEVGKARQKCVEHVLSIPKEDRPKWLFFLGDDMLPPWEGFIRLYEEAENNNWDCLTGLYRMKQDWFPTYLLWRNDIVGRMQAGRDFKFGDVVDVDLTGLDFTLIRTSLLERMSDGTFFKTGPTPISEVPYMEKYGKSKDGILLHTEDVWFYNRARELNAKIGVHTGIRVSHLDVKTGLIY